MRDVDVQRGDEGNHFLVPHHLCLGHAGLAAAAITEAEQSRTRRQPFSRQEAMASKKGVAHIHGATTQALQKRAKKKPRALLHGAEFFGGSCEIRTRDQRIKSPLLYRLS